jgi:hypothetical protein
MTSVSNVGQMGYINNPDAPLSETLTTFVTASSHTSGIYKSVFTRTGTLVNWVMTLSSGSAVITGGGPSSLGFITNNTIPASMRPADYTNMSTRCASMIVGGVNTMVNMEVTGASVSFVSPIALSSTFTFKGFSVTYNLV